MGKIPGEKPDWFPTTRLGNMLSTSVGMAVFTLDYAMPLIAITSYRLIPDARRSRMFKGKPASLKAVGDLRKAGGGGWQIIKIAASNHKLYR